MNRYDIALGKKPSFKPVKCSDFATSAAKYTTQTLLNVTVPVSTDSRTYLINRNNDVFSTSAVFSCPLYLEDNHNPNGYAVMNTGFEIANPNGFTRVIMT
jgi:hypothetical protein